MPFKLGPHLTQAEKKAIHEIVEFLQTALSDTFDAGSCVIEYPPHSEMGNLAVPCFHFAKKIKTSPIEVARGLAERFATYSQDRPGLMTIKAVNYGPYVNFFLNPAAYAAEVLDQVLAEGERFGNTNAGNGEKIMLEYSQPNTHKEFHVGHLRNVCLGSSIVNIYRASGYKVTAVNYINDTGTHVAKCLWAYLKEYQKQPLPENKGKFLGQVYVAANRLLEQHPEYKDEVAAVAQKLETKDRQLTKLWKQTRQWSLDQFYSIYKSLGVEFDEYFFDSDIIVAGKKVVTELLQKKIAQKSNGAVIVDLEKYGLRTFLILKSDGTALYVTKDLALAQKKFKKYKIDKSFYVVDVRQSLYFQQLFKTLELLGFKKEMRHIAYDFVTLKSGTMSSRTGNVILFEDFETEMIKKVLAETKERHPEWKDEECLRTATLIAHGAMKYTMLSNGNHTPVIFDMDTALKLQGKTGPYLQYVHARISSLLKKSNLHVSRISEATNLNQPEERAVIEFLARFPGAITHCAETADPSHLAAYLYDLAKLFSVFYETVPILSASEPERKQKLALVRAVQIVMARGLGILGMAAPDVM